MGCEVKHRFFWGGKGFCSFNRNSVYAKFQSQRGRGKDGATQSQVNLLYNNQKTVHKKTTAPAERHEEHLLAVLSSASLLPRWRGRLQRQEVEAARYKSEGGLVGRL
jgi:hypothetical protein